MNRELVAVFTEKGLLLDTDATKSKQYYTNSKLLSDFSVSPYKALLYFGFADKAPDMHPSILFIHDIASLFVEKLSKNPDIEISRTAEALSAEDNSALLQRRPYVIGAEYVDQDWLSGLWDNLCEAFATELAAFSGSVAQFLLTYNSHINVAGRVFFHLVENNKTPSHPFAFLATYSRSSAKHNKAEHVPLRDALLEYRDNQPLLLRLLSTVSRAAEASNFISVLVESGELFALLRFTAEEAYLFLKEIPLYEACGILCRIPDWWKKKYNAVRVTVSIGEKPPSHMGIDALLSYEPALSVDGMEITREELERLLAQTEGLSLLKGKWVEVDHDKLREVLDAYDQAGEIGEGISFAEAMRIQMGLTGLRSSAAGDALEITNGQWLNTAMESLKSKTIRQRVGAGDDFYTVLRPYQQDGLDWLASMKHMGFGALLADDMGLGKTVQILALLEYLRQRRNEKTLLIIPASLIGNWQKEMQRFTPKLRYTVLHANKAKLVLEEADVFITTYGMAAKLEALQSTTWDLLILDEAQAIKNPGTKQTKAVKSIPAKFHVAMTGTPVENRLSDLWSLFDFLNAGLLGNAKEFGGYAKKIQNNASYARLRQVISPFILRRLKTDKSIIRDLPDKVEMKAYAALSKKQVVLYTALVKELERQLDATEGIQRKGIVLAGIMKFKQICNHPDQYLGQDVFEHTHSGKFQLLAELCETIRDKRERVLVFTQFREMCEPLSDYLEDLFGTKGLILHGGTPVKNRTELVERFNGDEYAPYMVLSLKAGGVGLNLTAANHVIHFDRWWNPAVENQATDRAFRIGQKRKVLVHKLITSGTIEEKIDIMIEEKLQLTDELITKSGENWITEMNSKELMDLFTLGA
ncbi:MAG: DEAD/DEAH box helicase [Clostridiales bacterium]|nr:DEAD/DEAH box helicase [Clostridiales bacterium]